MVDLSIRQTQPSVSTNFWGWDVFTNFWWWEIQRIPFNILVIVLWFFFSLVCLSFDEASGYLEFVGVEDTPPIFYLIPNLIIANLSYCSAWLFTPMVRKLTPFNRVTICKLNWIVILYYTVGITSLPSVFAFLRFVRIIPFE